MKLFLLTIKESGGYDSYDGFVVAADSEEEVRDFFGLGYGSVHRGKESIGCGDECDSGDKYEDKHNCVWSRKEGASCVYIGEANENVKKGLILGSFNAG